MDLFLYFLNVSSAASHRLTTHEQTWSPTSAETLMQTRGDPGVTPPTPTPAGNTAMLPAALVTFIYFVSFVCLCVCDINPFSRYFTVNHRIYMSTLFCRVKCTVGTHLEKVSTGV